MIVQLVHTSAYSESVGYSKKYFDALEAYNVKDFVRVKKILEPVANDKITASVQREGSVMFLGPAILDLLGWTYADEKNYDKALEMFKQMEKIYPKEEFRGRLEGEGYYGGPGGAVGLRNQVLIYAAPQWLFQDPELKANYKNAVEASRRLIKKYPHTFAPCWEGCGTFSNFVIRLLGECLSRESAKEFDALIGGLIGLLPPEENILIASTKMQIANKYREEKDFPLAIKVYAEVVKKNLYTYYISEMDGVSEFYGLDSISAIIQIQQEQNANPADIKKNKEVFRSACENFPKMVDSASSESVVNELRYKCLVSPVDEPK